jgi:hypothetical protein
VYLGEKENATIRYEATVDMVYIYLGDVSLWNSGEKISDEEKGVIKKRYRSSRPKKLERRMGILPCFRVGTMIWVGSHGFTSRQFPGGVTHWQILILLLERYPPSDILLLTFRHG